MTVQAEAFNDAGAWIDRQYGGEVELELNDASTTVPQMALGAIVIAVLFALSLAVWACGPVAFHGLRHAPSSAGSSFLLPHSPG
jgi:hypothetical protein